MPEKRKPDKAKNKGNALKNNLPKEPSQKSKFAPKRNETQKAKDRKLISELSLRGWTGREMETHPELNHITYRQINDDLIGIRKEWAKETNIDIDEFKARQLKRLDDSYSELNDSWDGSKFFLSSNYYKDAPDAVKKKLDKIAEALQKIGNHNYQKIAIEAIKEQNKIMGIYAAEKIELKDTTIDFTD